MGKIINLIFSLIFLFSLLNLTDLLIIKGIFFVYIFISLSITILVFLKKKEIEINRKTLITMYLFIFFCVLSSLIIGDFGAIFNLIIIAFFYVFSFIILPNLKININKSLVCTVLIVQIPTVLIPLIINGIETKPYQGIFYNPNSFGMITATTFAVLFSCFLVKLENLIRDYKENYYKTKIFIWVLLLLFIFYLIIISSSRTSFISSIICMVVGLLYLTVYSIKNRSFPRLVIKGSFFAIIMAIPTVLIFKFSPLYKDLKEDILNKFNLQTTNGDMLSNRGEIWKRTINDAGFFGKGNNYFADNISIGAHNTFIGIIGVYGWIPTILFVLFLIMCFFYAAKYSLSNINDKYKYLPLMLVINFLTLSMAEDMLFTLSMSIMFFSLGTTFSYKNIKGVKKVKIDELPITKKKISYI